MNKALFSKILPHLIAFVVFLVIAVIYCRPALEGQVLQQHDITQWEGSVQQSMEYKNTHGHFPLWTNSMFGGMPTFQISSDSNNFVPGIVHTILTLGLPSPIQFFFLACICFYFLCLVLRINPYIGILGSLGFAYASYNPTIIIAGHATKMWAMAYMPALLGAILLIFDKKYWIGAALTALFSGTMIAMNHPQIAYYFFIMVTIMTLFFIVKWIREKQIKHLVVALGFTIVAGLVGVLINSVNLLSTYEYQKETIRGGGSVLTDTTRKETKPQTGLDRDYAFSYSAGIAEPFVMLVPRMFGGSTSYPSAVGGKGYREMNEENSKAVEALQSMPPQLANQIAGSSTLYWGGIGSVQGPVYVGAIICFLAILSLFLPNNRHRWWALAAIVLTIMMSWGSYFKEFNYPLYDLLPFYNKFRAPSMILVIPQLLLPMLAAIAVNTYAQATDKKALMPYFKKGLIATGAVVLVLLLLYFSMDFLAEGDKAILKQVKSANQPQLSEAVKPFFDGLVSDRKGLMMGDLLRSIGFMLVAAGALFALIRGSIKPLAATVLITVFSFIDVIVIDSKYLNKDNYEDKQANENRFQKTKTDETILADTSYYRVFNFASDAFQEAITSYHYNSLGGYHAVKLRLYQDIIERQFSQGQPNMAVLNMLNTKYFIQKDQNGLTQQYQKNEGALGPVWLVNQIQFVKNADDEMAALNHFNPKDTAIIQESFRSSIPFIPVADSAATVALIHNDNDVITYKFNAASNQFVVFSEVYYKSGWRAFIDGKEAAIVKTDYVLRGLAVPAGSHSIEFRFEPKAYATGRQLTSIFTIIMVLLLAAGIFFEWRAHKKPALPKA